MDIEQILKATVNAIHVWSSWQFFYARMGKEGRIVIPKLTQALLRSEKTNLAGYIMDVTLEPT